MTRQIDRRRLVVGAAWTVPAVVVAGAAPAVAASVAGCPQLISVDPPVFFTSKTSATVQLSFTGVVGTPSIQVLSVSGVSFTGPLGTTAITGLTLNLTFTRSNSGFGQGDVTVVYQLKNAAGAACGPNASFTFFYTTNPV